MLIRVFSTVRSVSGTLSRSACVITGGSAQAVALADALQEAVGALHTVRVRQSQLIDVRSAEDLLEFAFFFFSPLSPHPRASNLPPPHKLTVSSTWVARW